MASAYSTAPPPTIDEVTKLLANDGEAADYLGYSVAVNGDTAVIGAYGDDDLGTSSGSAAPSMWMLIPL